MDDILKQLTSAASITSYIAISAFFFCAFSPRKGVSALRCLIEVVLLVVSSSVLTALIFAKVLPKYPVFLVIQFLGIWAIYRDKFIRTLIIVVLQALMLIVSELLYGVILNLIFKIPVSETVNTPFQYLTCFFYILIFTIGCIIAVRNRKLSSFSVKDMERLAMLPISQAGILVVFYIEIQITHADFWYAVFTPLLMLALCIIVDIVFFAFVRELIVKRQSEAISKMRLSYYSALSTQMEQLRALRHDLSNHLMVIEELHTKNPEESRKYAQKVKDEFRNATKGSHCDSDIANAVLLLSSAEAEKRGIKFSADAVLDKYNGIEETDLMSLLSNLLDNAIEGAALCENGEVSITIRQKMQNVMISVKNTITDAQNIDLSHTSKKVKELHGFGVGIINSIAAKYNGYAEREVSDHFFFCTVLLIAKS